MLPLSLGLTLAIISFIGFVINGYILLVVVLSKQVSANNILLLHLGIVNAVLCLLFLVFSLPSIFARNDGMAALEGVCSTHGFLLILVHPIALWTICCLNCDRYYAIAAPLHYSAIVNTKKVLTALASGWLTAIALGIPPLFGVAPYWYNREFGACIPRFEQYGSLWYAIVFAMVTFIVPGIIIIGCNIRVLMIARYHRHRIAAAIYEVTLSAQVTITHQRNPFLVPLAGPKFRSRSPVSTVLQLIGSFVILYCPYYLIILWNSSVAALYNGNIPRSLEPHRFLVTTSSILLTFCASVNGILYGVKSKTMRKTFQNYWRKKKTKNEITQEIQARTPSTCGSRRPSLAALGIFNRPAPQRRLSETLVDMERSRYMDDKPTMKRVSSEISWRPSSLTFAEHEPKRSIPQTSSCNTLQIPGSQRDLSTDPDEEDFTNLYNSRKSSARIKESAYQNHSKPSFSVASTLLHKVLRIEINEPVEYSAVNEPLYKNSIKSPRILITRAYSEDSDAAASVASMELSGPHSIITHHNQDSVSNNKRSTSLRDTKFKSRHTSSFEKSSDDRIEAFSSRIASKMSLRKYSSLDEQYSCGSISESESTEEQILLSWPITRRKYTTTIQTHRAYNRSDITRPNPVYNDRCEKPDVVL